jgi:hypothetical protein
MQFWIASANKLATLSLAALTAAICLPCSGIAQDAKDVFSLFRGLAQTTLVQSAQQAWSRLPDEELACLNKICHQAGPGTRDSVEVGETGGHEGSFGE